MNLLHNIVQLLGQYCRVECINKSCRAAERGEISVEDSEGGVKEFLMVTGRDDFLWC